MANTDLPLKQHLEKFLQARVRDFLAYRGWRIFRHNPTVATAGEHVFSSGEKGMPDLEGKYYFRHGVSLTLYLELKQAGKPLRDSQAKWHLYEKKRGAEVWKVDDFESFEQRYYAQFGWLHAGEKARGQIELLFADLPGHLHPTHSGGRA